VRARKECNPAPSPAPRRADQPADAAATPNGQGGSSDSALQPTTDCIVVFTCSDADDLREDIASRLLPLQTLPNGRSSTGINLDHLNPQSIDSATSTKTIEQSASSMVNAAWNHGAMHLFTIHHVAATGGSIMSQAISALTNSILISEINPKAGIAKTESMFNRTSLVEHCCRASGSDLDDILKQEYFTTQLDICIKHARATGRTILLRDHSQSSFNHGAPAPRSDFMDSIQKWKNSSPVTCKTLPILSIRHPLDSFLSARKRGWHSRLSKTGRLDQYCKNLLRFQDYFSTFSTTVRYEDLCRDYRGFLCNLAENLDITAHTPSAEEIQTITITGKSGRKSNDISPRTRNIAEIDADLHAQAMESNQYKETCQRYGYNPDIHEPPI
jgi:hypothetical protein